MRQELPLAADQVDVLDEPTNDLDIETLNVIEDFLDGWPGTLVVVSHDRYFLERVCDTVWALLGDGLVSMLPRGVDEYLEHRARSRQASAAVAGSSGPAGAAPPAAVVPGEKAKPGSAGERTARKTLARISADEAGLNAEIAESAHDYERLAELSARLHALHTERGRVESEWLEAAELLD